MFTIIVFIVDILYLVCYYSDLPLFPHPAIIPLCDVLETWRLA